jgi:small subunit ribosomal protein S18
LAEFFRKKKRICQLCAGRTLNYKDVNIIEKYISENGKILPRRVTGACAKHQRFIAGEVKKARFMALVKYTG